MSKLNIAKIAIENTSYHFDKEYSYLIPDYMLPMAAPGCRVKVSFGKGGQTRLGLITELTDEFDGKGKLKPILEVLDAEPVLNDEMLRLARWIKEHTFCTLYEASRVLLPTGINHKLQISYSITDKEAKAESLDEQEKLVFEYLAQRRGFIRRDKLLKAAGLHEPSGVPDSLVSKGLIQKSYEAVRNSGDAVVRMVRLTDAAKLEGFSGKLSDKQQEVISLLSEMGCASVREICYFTGFTASVVMSLQKKGLLEFYEDEVYRNPYASVDTPGEQTEIILTDEQHRAYRELSRNRSSEPGKTSLLFGVTGSGKTQVYLKLIDDVVAENKGVIVMVPEISLTPQVLSIFHKRYGKNVAVFHSALSISQRLDEWKRVNNGEACIVVGTRSAVFAPLKNIGLIIVDEEQEHTYKSEQSPRYNAKEVAKFRCAVHKAMLLLASATPSVESYALALKGKYSLSTLENRYGNAVLPEVVTVDMCREQQEGNTAPLSRELIDAVFENREQGHQSILLINRRGYNTFAACTKCRAVVTCPSCSISMTYHHANNKLMCHYCGYSTDFSTVCSSCGEDSVRYSGFGTQKIEDEIKELLPGINILRMDADSTMAKNSREQKLEAFAKGEYDVLIGTQMVAKGLDFENVTLVGVVSVDQQLHNDDYRSFERPFDLLTQVVGRAGRGQYKGKAIIQTLTPENNVIKLAADQDYRSFFDTEIQLRKMLIYPPFCDLCVLSISGENEIDVQNGAKDILDVIKEETYKYDQKIIVLGPMPARVLKVSNRYRYRIIIKCKNSAKFRSMISELLFNVSENSRFNKITVFADINPENIL